MKIFGSTSVHHVGQFEINDTLFEMVCFFEPDTGKCFDYKLYIKNKGDTGFEQLDDCEEAEQEYGLGIDKMIDECWKECETLL